MVDWTTVASSVVAAGGGGAAVAYSIFKGFGSKWLEHRFAAQLEKSRQDHATETEHLRFKIASLLDRSTKLNQREFEILPDIWEKANDAYQDVAYLLHRYRQRPDLERLREDRFDEWLSSIDLPQTTKSDLKAASPRERGEIYGDAMKWKELQDAQVSVGKFSHSLSKGSIYLQPNTYERLDAFYRHISSALHNQTFLLQHPPQRGDAPLNADEADAFRQSGDKWFTELGDFLRNRYWSVELATPGARVD